MNEEQAKRLVEKYADMILRISFHYLKTVCDAEDLCQDVLVKYISAARSFESEEHEKAWIIRTTINLCKNRLKSSFFRNRVSLDEIAERAAPENPDTGVLEMIGELPRNQRISLYLYYYEGYTAREIGRMIGKSENAVASYLSRGRKKLKAMLMSEGGEYGRYVKREHRDVYGEASVF